MAAQKAQCGRTMHYEWLKKDPDYPALYADAMEQAADRLEQEALRRAVVGLRRLKFGKDGVPLVDPETGQPYVEYEYSDTLLIFLLKGARPEKFRERYEHQHSGQLNVASLHTLLRIVDEAEMPAVISADGREMVRGEDGVLRLPAGDNGKDGRGVGGNGDE